MTTTLFTRLLTTAALAGFTTCTAHAQEKSSRPVTAPFEMVESSGGIDVYLTQGSTASVSVEAEAEALAHIVTEVKNETLSIYWERNYSLRGMSTKQRQVKVYITAPRLTSLSLSGGSDARSQNQLTADNFRIEASGGSDVFLTLRAKTLRTDASGGSDVTLTGKVKRQEMRFSGGSDYHGFALQSTTANIEASGGSDADVWVNGELVASASGGSDLHYKGTARSITSLSSSGSSAAKHVE